MAVNSLVNNSPVVDQYDVRNIPADSALLLVYAAADKGRIMKVQTSGAPI